jgi:phosphoribosylanthranilate isomerase
MALRIKICCIASPEEAAVAIAAGASAIGLVSAMPSGPGVIGEDAIQEIAASVGTTAETFLLTSLQTADAIIAQHARCNTSTLQLVDHVPHADLVAVRRALPHVKLVQVIHVNGPESVQEARAVMPLVDAVLLDSGNQNLAVKELGGTGRTHDWAVSRAIRETLVVPMYLAGGLRTENVAAAIATVSPYGIDVCSGVRSEGRLDRAKLARFVDAARAASAPSKP